MSEDEILRSYPALRAEDLANALGLCAIALHRNRRRDPRERKRLTMARFYSNENFPLLTVIKLREFGHDVVTASEAGNANQRTPDEAVSIESTSLGSITERPVMPGLLFVHWTQTSPGKQAVSMKRPRFTPTWLAC